MIDLEILREHGLTEDNLRLWLSGNPLTWTADANSPEGRRHACWNRIRSRIQEGMNRNFQEYRIWHALDTAWDIPFKQVTATMLGTFINKDPNDESVYQEMMQWGFTHLITQEVDKRTGKPTGKKAFNLPIFFEIFVPLVRAYVGMRWAKIMNDRDLTPFFKYDPAKLTTMMKLRCDAITDRVQIMSNQYGFYDVVKQAVLKMLHYSWCFQFPKEEWHSEEQLKRADKTDVAAKKKNLNGEPCKEGDTIKVTTREGLRYHLPHPTRFYRDLNHPNYTYNYGFGAEFAGYWNIRRYRDIYYSNFWNRDAISIGPNSLIQDHRTFFASVYSACTLVIPTLPSKTNDGNTLIAQTGGGVGDLDREKQLAYLYYGVDRLDQGVLTTEHFEKLNPLENGLGTYDGPVWFRFVMAGDNATFLYAAPLPYDPTIYYGYDADESRTLNPGMSMEVLPFQDHFSNTLSQIILTAKQNLANLTFIDEDQIPEETRSKIENLGERFFRFLNVFGYSGKKAVRVQNRIVEAVQSHSFPKGNVAELQNVLKGILDVLERVLAMSSQEVAQAASHEQTREEVRVIQASTSTRVMFTSKPVDIAREAMKRQVYQGLMAYGDDDFYTHIPSDFPLNKEALKEMGFTFVDKDEMVGAKDTHRRARVKKKLTAIELWEIASQRDGTDRPSDAGMATVMGQLVNQLLANPMIAPAIGAQQAIDIANQIAQLAGLPRDFKLKDMSQQPNPAQAQQADAQAQLQGVIQTVLQQVNAGLQQELKPLLDRTMENSRDIALVVRALGIQVPNPATVNGEVPSPTPSPTNAPNPEPANAGGPS